MIPSHLLVSIFNSTSYMCVCIYIHTHQYTFWKVTISFNWKEDLLKPAIKYFPMCLTLLGQKQPWVQNFPNSKTVLLLPLLFLFPSKNWYRSSICEFRLFRTKKLCTTEPEWKRMSQTFGRAWKKGTEQFGAHRPARVPPLKWLSTHTSRAFCSCL